MKALQPALPLTPSHCSHTTRRRLRLEIADDCIDVLINAADSDDSCLYCRIAIDRSVSSRAKAVEELVYANPLLLCDFQKVDVVVRRHDTLVAPGGFGAWLPCDNACEILMGNMPQFGAQAICRVDSNLMKFIRRTFNAPAIYDHLSPLCNYLARDRRRSNRAKAYLQLSDRTADVIIIDHRGLQHAVSYAIGSPSDAVYYTLAAMLSVSFDRLEGELMIVGTPELRRQTMPILRKYVNSVMPLILPADFCADSPLELNTV